MSAIPILRPAVREEVPPKTRPYNRAIGCSRPGAASCRPAGAADDEPVPAEPGASLAPEPPEARLTVAAVARRLGVAPATLRTWDRRYGLGPTLHSAGFTPALLASDIARLETMRRLVLDGVPPADAARLAVDRVADPRPGRTPRPGTVRPARRRSTGGRAARPAGGPGGRVLALPGGTAETRGLARAAMALDAGSITGRGRAGGGRARRDPDLDRAALPRAGRGRRAVGGHRRGRGGGTPAGRDRGSALRAVSIAPEPRNGRPVLLACAPEEQHSLPLAALAAALAEQGIGARLLGGGLPAGGAAGGGTPDRARGADGLGARARLADVQVLDALPVLRAAGGRAGRRRRLGGRPLPARVTYAPDLAAAVASSPARSAAEWVRRRPASGPPSRGRAERAAWFGRPRRRRARCWPDRPGRARAGAGAVAGRGLSRGDRVATGRRPAGWRRAASRPDRWPPAAWPATCARSAGTRRPNRSDRLALATAADAEARADALIGLVADASAGTSSTSPGNGSRRPPMGEPR